MVFSACLSFIASEVQSVSTYCKNILLMLLVGSSAPSKNDFCENIPAETA